MQRYKYTKINVLDKSVVCDKKLDIRGLACPYTFVKAKLAIEAMDTGQLLELLLDSEDASNSIPRSMKEHGHSVLRTEKINESEWILLIRKGTE